MRKITLSLLFFLLYVGLHAKPIDALTARRVAVGQFNASGALRNLSAADLELIWTGHLSVRATDGAPFYLFANKTGGFALIAGDDRARPVLGYGEEGGFDPLKMPAHVAAWINHYKEQIDWLQANTGYSDPDATAQWEALLNQRAASSQMVKKIQTANWDQSPLYNKYCPQFIVETETVTAPTGCGATAMAIYMKATADRPTKIKEGAIVEFDVPNAISGVKRTLPASYPFNRMPDQLTNQSTEEEIDAVATLMADCGAVSFMEYTPNGSGAYRSDMGIGMIDYFGYSKTAEYHYASSMEATEWIDKLCREIDEGRPSLYFGLDTIGGGHIFILDGYTNDSPARFSVNFGWSGYANGIYALDALKPEKTNSDYSFKQDALFGLVPPKENDMYKPNFTLKKFIFQDRLYIGLSANTQSFAKEVPFDLTVGGIANSTLVPELEAEFRIYHMNADNTPVDLIAKRTKIFETGYTYYQTFSNLTLRTAPKSGDKLRVYMAPQGSDIETEELWLKGPKEVVSEIFLTPTGVNQTEQSPVKIYAAGNQLVIAGEGAVGLTAKAYSLSGTVEKEWVVSTSPHSVTLPSGIYVIKAGNREKKVSIGQ